MAPSMADAVKAIFVATLELEWKLIPSPGFSPIAGSSGISAESFVFYSDKLSEAIIDNDV